MHKKTYLLPSTSEITFDKRGRHEKSEIRVFLWIIEHHKVLEFFRGQDFHGKRLCRKCKLRKVDTREEKREPFRHAGICHQYKCIRKLLRRREITERFSEDRKSTRLNSSHSSISYA